MSLTAGGPVLPSTSVLAKPSVQVTEAVTLPGWLSLLCGLALAQVYFASLLPLAELEAPLSWLTAYWDDFFYYLQIARNVATDFRSTFDGVGLTNGYHPLWLAILAALCVVFDPTRIEFHYAVATLTGGLSILTAVAIFTYVRAVFALSPLAALAVGLIGQTQHEMLARHGMEIALAVPLVFCFAIAGHRFVSAPSAARMAAWSGLGALCILARLDSATVVALLGALVLLRTPLETLRRWATPGIAVGLAAGIAPLLAYAGLNWAVFGTPAPVSGQAKHLADFPVFSTHMLYYAVVSPIQRLPHLTPYVVNGLVPGLIALTALLAWRRSRPDDSYWRDAQLALLMFPFVHLTILFLVSDWILWTWYFYPFIIAVAAAMAGLVRAATLRLSDRNGSTDLGGVAVIATLVAAGLFAAFVSFAIIKPRPAETRLEYGIAEASLAIARFAEQHDGRFAMGDRAGRVGFLVPNRVLQLEGLVGTREFLANIRDQADLLDVLRRHGVRYYIGTRMPEEGGCHTALEPKTKQAGAKSPRMTGRFCADPVFRHVDLDGVTTLIFDVSRERSFGNLR
jgi:hypothetical protein